MGTSEIPLVAAFFIGLMTAISPCPLATNITAIAYVSRKLDNSRHTLLVGFLYAAGRAFAYAALASLIVYVGVNTVQISSFIQAYGEKLLGPLLLVVGVVMLELVKINFPVGGSQMASIQAKLADKGYCGAFLLGVVFALAFCPLSAVLFFGMLLPLALKTGDAVLLPSVFGLATGLPVMFFSVLLAKGVSKLSQTVNKAQKIEKWMRLAVGTVFILVGLYYITLLFSG
ncbi:MAG: aromatic aminobenezylarsenical efflux permease ArsG family transporter [Candidatus Micrarchaeota archaeon]|nr:aromatic aminobenezylarsenical efflux permease ArsG family transporter [Candidatus Micrarchaeota archaeon]